MKNLIKLFTFILLSNYASAQQVYTLVDHQHAYNEASQIENVTNLIYDENGGEIEYKFKYPNGCIDFYHLSWEIKDDLTMIEIGDQVEVELNCISRVRNCTYKWDNMQVWPSSNTYISKLPFPPDDLEYGSSIEKVTGDVLDLYDLYPGKTATTLLECQSISEEYTAFSIYISNIKLTVFYLFKLTDKEDLNPQQGEVNCGALYGLAYNTGALHVRSGHNDNRADIIQTIDNILVHVEASNCFDGSYLVDLRSRIMASTVPTIDFLPEIEDFMHGIVDQVAEECPCCATCNETVPVDCSIPDKTEFISTDISSNSAILEALDDADLEFRFRLWGQEEWEIPEVTVGIVFLNNLQPGSFYEYQARRRCDHGNSEWSDSYFFETAQEVCHALGMADFYPDQITSHSAVLQSNIIDEVVEFRYRLDGSTIWFYRIANADGQAILNSLKCNAAYELQARVLCMQSSSEWSYTQFFQTKEEDVQEICSTPERTDITMTKVDIDSIILQTTLVAELYTWAYRKYGYNEWKVFEIENLKQFWITDPGANTLYEFKLKIKCEDGFWTDYSPIVLIQTPYGGLGRKSSGINGSSSLQAGDLKGIDKSSNKLELNVFPNPVDTKFKVTGSFGKGKAEISDAMGKSLGTYDDFKSGDYIDVSNLKPGHYYLRLHNSDVNTTKTIIVQ